MLAYKGIDADNHYYEPLDAFTRYLDPAFKRRGIRPVQNGRRTELLADGQLLEFIPNPTFDPVIVPGCLDVAFRGQIPEGVDPRTLMKVEPLSPAYQNKEARLEAMDKQNLEAILLFPTLGCGVEEALAHDIPATVASLRAFNRWLEDDWGFGADGRVIAVPMISLAHPEAAAAEVDDLAGRGARMIHIRPAPVPGSRGSSRSLGDPLHDIVWERLQAHDIPVGFHLGDSGYNRFASAWGGPERSSRSASPTISAASSLRTERFTTPWQASSFMAYSPDSLTSGSRVSKTAPTGCTCCSSGSTSRQT
jgi:hypothetical protein